MTRAVPDVRSPGAPAFYGLLEFIVERADLDGSECSCRPGPWLAELTELGVPAVVIGLGDAGLGTSIAVQSEDRLPASTSLHADFRQALQTGPLRCASSVADLHDGVALTTGAITSNDGPVATLTLRSMLIRPRTGAADVSRSAPVRLHPAAASETLSGVLGSGLAQACGVEITGLDDRELTMRLTPAVELGRTYGVVHGGGVGTIGSLGIAALRERILRSRRAVHRHLDVHVDFLRELPASAEVEVASTVRHLGRRLAVFEATVTDVAGQAAAIVREAVILRPDDRRS